jgi:uncharacterized protein (TIGR03435 family)
VADVRPSNPANPLAAKGGGFLPGGRVELAGLTLKNLIMFAYGVQENMIVGVPKWGESEHFDIIAKAAPNTSLATVRLMVQSLLAERFQLALHSEDRVMPAYVLTLGKRGPSLTEGSGGRQQCAWKTAEGGLMRRDCQNLTMAEFAKQLPGMRELSIDRPVVDQTGLNGDYDFHFDIARVRRPGDAGASDPADSGPTIFAALENIGLKLEHRKIPLPTLVIDHVEPPGGN